MIEQGAVSAPRRLFRGDRTYVFGCALILLALAVRVGWSAWIAHAHPAAVANGDTQGYLDPARALIEHRHFSLSPQDDTPMYWRTPGYPVLLAGILWVTDSRWSISPIQAALSALTVLVVVLVGRRLISPSAGLLAGLFTALDPLQFALSGTLLSESLTSLLLAGVAAAGVPVFIRQPERVQMRYVVGLGALIAVATTVRPTTYYFPVVVVVLLAVRMRHLPWRSTLALLLAFLAPILLIVGGWNLRNHEVMDTWQFAGSQPLTLYCWQGAAVEAHATGVGIREARRELGCAPGGWDNLATVCPSWWACDAERPLADGPSWDEMGSRGIDILKKHPVLTGEDTLKGLAREVAGPGTDTVGRFLHVRSSPLLVALLFLWNALLWSLALVGAVVALRSPQRWYFGFVISMVVYVLVISAGANASARFRTPLVPLLALLAAIGALHVVRWMRGSLDPVITGSAGTSSQAGRPQRAPRSTP